MNWFKRFLQGFEYDGVGEFFLSLYPSLKYLSLPKITLVFSAFTGLIVKLFGLDWFALTALGIMFLFELLTGLGRARKMNEDISSHRFSRFSLKFCYYFVIIMTLHQFSLNFELQGKELASDVLGYMYAFAIAQIIVENIISVTENIAVINGKPKSAWITKLIDKVDNFFK